MSAPLYRDLPLDTRENTIRLWSFDNTRAYSVDGCTLLLEMSVFTQESCPDYIALSYTWQDDIIQDLPILVNERRLHITHNLHVFIQYLRLRGVGMRGPKWFFADQISLDQNNQHEREHQVSLMGSIYSKAHTVFAWLGLAPDDCYDADAFLELDRNFRHQENCRQIVHTLMGLAYSKYWSRLWIVQELYLAKNAIFWYGRHTIRRRILYNNLRQLVSFVEHDEDFLGDTYNIDSDDEMERLDQGLDFIDAWVKISLLLRPSIQKTGGRSLFSILTKYCENDCADRRDKVLGLQALIVPDQKIPIDYSKGEALLSYLALKVMIQHMSPLPYGDANWTLFSEPDKQYSDDIRKLRLFSKSMVTSPSGEKTVAALVWAHLVPRSPGDLGVFGHEKLVFALTKISRSALPGPERSLAGKLCDAYLVRKSGRSRHAKERDPVRLYVERASTDKSLTAFTSILVTAAESLGFLMFGDFMVHPDDPILGEFVDTEDSVTVSEYFASRPITK